MITVYITVKGGVAEVVGKQIKGGDLDRIEVCIVDYDSESFAQYECPELSQQEVDELEKDLQED